MLWVFGESGIRLADYEEPYEIFTDETGEVVGASSFGRREDSDGHREASFSVAVLPSARRQGIARRLVQSILNKHPGTTFRPWVVNPGMAALLEDMGFSPESSVRGWHQDAPYMELETPTREQVRRRKEREAAPSNPLWTTLPHPPPGDWREGFTGPLTLDHLDLSPGEVAEGVRLRAWYAERPEIRQAKIIELLSRRCPVPGLTGLTVPGTGPQSGHFWQIVLKADDKGHDEDRGTRAARLLRRMPARGSSVERMAASPERVPVQQDLPWDLDEVLMERDPFRAGRTTSRERMVADLAAFSLVGLVGTKEAQRLAKNWVDAKWPLLVNAKNLPDIIALFRDFEEVEFEASEKYRQTERDRLEREADELARVVAIQRDRAHAYNPKPVESVTRGQSWAALGALPQMLYHATPYGLAIEKVGLLPRSATQRHSLGGGPDHVVSLTPLKHAAERIAAMFLALNEAADDPTGVLSWFKVRWLPPLQQFDPQTAARFRGHSSDPYHQLRDLLNIGSAALGRKNPAMLLPLVIGHRIAVDPAGIGVVRVYANVDTVIDQNRGQIVAGLGVGSKGEELRSVATACPPLRGGPQTQRFGGRLRWLARAAIATGSENPFEANEIRVCPGDAVVVGFTPVTEWRSLFTP